MYFQAKQKYKIAKLQPLFEGPFDLVRFKPPNVYYKVGKNICVPHMIRVKIANLVTSKLSNEQFCSPQYQSRADDHIVQVEHTFAPQRVASPPPISPSLPLPADVIWFFLRLLEATKLLTGLLILTPRLTRKIMRNRSLAMIYIYIYFDRPMDQNK